MKKEKTHSRAPNSVNLRIFALVVLVHGALGFVGILLAVVFIPNGPVQMTIIGGVGASILLVSIFSLIFLRRQEKLERVRQNELRESKEHLQLALQAARMGTWDWDISTGQMRWSPDVESIFGIERGAFKGTFESYIELLPEEEKPKVQGVINNTLDSGRTDYHAIHSVRTRENEIRWIESRGVVERNITQTPISITGTVMDITSRIRAESERALLLGRMEKRNTHLSTAARVSKSCNSILDPGQLIQQAVSLIAEGFDLYYVGLFLVKEQNAVLQAGYGEAGQKMAAGNYFLPLDEKSMIGWSVLHRKARIAQRAFNDEVRHRNPLLPETQSEMAMPLVSRGSVIGALTIQSRVEDAFSESDISILQTMSDQLAISIENARLFSDLQKELGQRMLFEHERESMILELEAKNAELERFTYTVSHDLKSPLITIRGFLGHLLDDVQKGELERMQDDAKRISDATNRMQRLLEELLELSRIGRLVSPPENVPFEQIAREALSLVEGRVASRGIQVHIQPDMPRVNVDRLRLVEAMQNLLDNAAKFMGDQLHPSIEIGCDQDGAQTIFFVKDNGIGIDPKFHSKVFGLFDKLNPGTEGTGVGLAIVKRIIEVHGGHIWLESSLGNGAVFFFTLPLPPAA